MDQGVCWANSNYLRDIFLFEVSLDGLPSFDINWVAIYPNSPLRPFPLCPSLQRPPQLFFFNSTTSDLRRPYFADLKKATFCVRHVAAFRDEWVLHSESAHARHAKNICTRRQLCLKNCQVLDANWPLFHLGSFEKEFWRAAFAKPQ